MGFAKRLFSNIQRVRVGTNKPVVGWSRATHSTLNQGDPQQAFLSLREDEREDRQQHPPTAETSLEDVCDRCTLSTNLSQRPTTDHDPAVPYPKAANDGRHEGEIASDDSSGSAMLWRHRCLQRLQLLGSDYVQRGAVLGGVRHP